jgi:hypothetical protein
MRAQRGSGIVRAREDGVVEEMSPKKLEAGRSVMGVEGFPKTDCPLDPEPGLGGMFSLGLFHGKSSLF